MRLRHLLAPASIVAAASALSLPASAAPTHNAQVFDCGAGPVTIFTSGRNGWIDGVKYTAVQATGTEDGEVVFVKVSGGGRQLSDRDAITCTATEADFTITVIAVPA